MSGRENGQLISARRIWPRLLGLVIGAVGLTATTIGFVTPAAHGATAPTVTSITPHSGPLEGTIQVAIFGSGFWCGTGGPDLPTSVNFGTHNVAAGQQLPTGQTPVELLTDSEILVDTPAASAAGGVDVTVTTPCGTSALTPNDIFTYESQCASTCTLSVAATTLGSPAAHVASGILDGDEGGFTNSTAQADTVSLLNNLGVARWRMGEPNSYTSQVLPQLTTRPSVEIDLDGWWQVATGGAGKLPPWNNMSSWNTFVTDMVTGSQFCNASCVSAPAPVAEWDVWNEPITFADYSPEGTVSTYLSLFAATYNDIKSVCSSCTVVVPTTSSMLDYVPEGGRFNGSNFIDFRTLLNYASTNNLHFDVYAFHDINDGATCDQSYPTYDVPSCNAYPLNWPGSVQDQVNRIHNLLAEYPSLEPANIEVNEFDSPGNYTVNPDLPGNQLMPGWQAGFIAAFEASGATGANLACWTIKYDSNQFSFSQCQKGFDGLMIDDENPLNGQQADTAIAPEAIYWVYKFYDSMRGDSVAVTSPASDLSGYATRNDSTDTVQVLLGRNKRCSINTSVDPQCPGGGAAITEHVQVNWPYAGSTAHYVLQQVPDTGNGLGGMLTSLPAATTGTATVTAGSLTVTVPSFSDGDAYELTLTPS